MRIHQRVFVALALCAGCGGGAASSTSAAELTEVTTPTHERAPAALALAEVRAMGPEGIVFELHADGTVIVQGEVIGTLGADGRFVAPGDDVVAVLEPDGTLRARGRPMATIDADAVATLDGGEELRFDADGTLHFQAAGVELRIEPADTPAKRAALVLIILLMV